MVSDLTKRSVAPGAIATADGDRRSIEGYQPLHRLAQSYLGPLWVARRPNDDDSEKLFLVRRVALSTAEPDAVWERLLQAGREALPISHPQVLPLVAALREGSRLGFAYEHIEAEPLRALQSWANLRSLSFPVEVSLRIVIDVLTGISAVHDHLSDPSLGFGGVSPDSVLVSRKGRTVVLDSGVASCACLLDSFGGSTAKLAYSAPEQLNLLAPLTAECDVFSCGVLLWELLASRRFVGGSRAAIERKLREHQLPKLEEALRSSRSTSDGLIELVNAALSADTADRPRSAKEFADCLADCGHPVADEGQVAHFVGLLSGQRFERRMTAIRSQSKPSFEAVRSPSEAPGPLAIKPNQAALSTAANPTAQVPGNLMRTDTPFGTVAVKPTVAAIAQQELDKHESSKPEPVNPGLSGSTIIGLPVKELLKREAAELERAHSQAAAPPVDPSDAVKAEPAEPEENQSKGETAEQPEAKSAFFPDTADTPASADRSTENSATESSSEEATSDKATSEGTASSSAAESAPLLSAEAPAAEASSTAGKTDSSPPAPSSNTSFFKTESTQAAAKDSTAPDEPLPVEREFDEGVIRQRNSAGPWNIRMGKPQPRRRVLAVGALAIFGSAGLFFLLLPPDLRVQVASDSEIPNIGAEVVAADDRTVDEKSPAKKVTSKKKPGSANEAAQPTSKASEEDAEKAKATVAKKSTATEEPGQIVTPPEGLAADTQDEAKEQAEVPAEPEAPAETNVRGVDSFDSKQLHVESLDDAMLESLFASEPSSPLPPCAKKIRLPRKTKRSQFARTERKKSGRALIAGNLDKAGIALCKAEHHYDPKGEAKRSLALLALQMGDGPQAVHWAELALKKTPKDSQARELLGDALATVGQFDKARRLWLRGARGKNTEAKNRRLAVNFTRLGNQALKRSRFSQARAMFRRALVLTQGGYGPSIGFSKSLLWLKAQETALVWTTRAEAAYPKDTKIQLLHGDTSFANGDKKNAMKAWKASQKLRPSRAARRRIAKGHP